MLIFVDIGSIQPTYQYRYQKVFSFNFCLLCQRQLIIKQVQNSEQQIQYFVQILEIRINLSVA